MRASVDQDGCISCGICTSVCPAVFHYNEEEKSEAIPAEIKDDDLEDAIQARDDCPVSVIDIFEE